MAEIYQATIEWKDTGEQETYLFCDVDEVQDNDENIFYYGIDQNVAISEIGNSENGEDWFFVSVEERWQSQLNTDRKDESLDMTDKNKPISELPVMKSHCKTCPFKPNDRGIEQNIHLANEVTKRTLFKGQQICHGTEGENREPRHRCYGSYSHNKTIYDRMGVGHLIK